MCKYKAIWLTPHREKTPLTQLTLALELSDETGIRHSERKTGRRTTWRQAYLYRRNNLLVVKANQPVYEHLRTDIAAIS